MRETVFAHRGLHGGDRAENSRSAFAAAIEAGLGIECDIRKSRDGRAIVFHDSDLGRLTGEDGLTEERSVGELTTLRLGDTPDTIPTLRDLLDDVAGDVPLLLEIKSERGQSISPLCLAVRTDLEGYRGPVAVMSFDPRVGQWFASHAREITRGLVITEENNRGFAGTMKRWFSVIDARPHFLAYDIRDLPSPFATRTCRKGRALLTWTVRSETQWRTARECGAAPIAEGPVLENRQDLS